jgi:hypothetical protein
MESVMAEKLAPGAHLGEQQLAQLFNCSRTIVREALIRRTQVVSKAALKRLKNHIARQKAAAAGARSMTVCSYWDILRNLLLAGRWTAALSVIAFVEGGCIGLVLFFYGPLRN